MKVDVTTEEEPYQKRLEVEIPWEDVQEEYEKSLREFRKDLELPGFRPGKVPVKVIKKQYGTQLEYQFASDALDEYYRQALDEIEEAPVNRGTIENLEFAEGEPLKFTARFDTEPDMDIFDYKNRFEVEHTVYESTPADVDQALEDLREQHAEVNEKDDGVEEGDLLLIDLQRVDQSGNPIIGQKVEDREIRVGEGLFGGENMERLRGAKKGDIRQIVVQPQDEGDEIEYYNVEVKRVEEQNLPELNDEFAKKVRGEAETYEELREQLQENIQDQLDQDANSQLSQRIAQKFVSQCETELPDSMIDNYLEMLMEDVKRRQASQSGSPPDIDEQVFRQNYRADAIYNLKWQLIKKQIIAQEGLDVDEGDLEARIQEIAESYPEENREAIQNLYRNEQYKRRLREDLLDEKVLEHIRSFADIKETTKTTTELRQEAQAREAAESAVRQPQ